MQPPKENNTLQKYPDANILIFTDWYLPGYRAGGPVRSLANLIAHLQGQFHFRIVTTNADYMENTPYPGVVANQWQQASMGEEVLYLSEDRLNYKVFRQIFRQATSDVVYINGIYSFYFSILPVFLARRFGIPALIAPRGMLSGQAFSAKKLKKQLFLFVASNVGLYKKASFHATLQSEHHDIHKRLKIPGKRIYTAPNLPRIAKTVAVQRPEKRPGHLKVVSIARISPEKNTLFALQCLTNITAPTIEFDLYGSIYNREYWQQCLHVIKQLPTNLKVHHKGPVSGDTIPELLTEYHILFMPTTGENFGHSILESLAAGLPVLISDKTPWHNLAAKHAGWELPLGDTEPFREKIRVAADFDTSAYMKWSAGAREAARAFTEDEELIKRYTRMFCAAAGKAQLDNLA